MSQSLAKPIAILVSGGLDSSVMLANIRRPVHPIYVRMGLPWENVEREYLDRFLGAIKSPTVRPLVVLDQPVADLYGEHWSMRGAPPGATAPDEDFYLPGRNVLLLSKALIWCRLNDVQLLNLGVLAANPFPDATPDWFRDYAAIVSQATGLCVEILHLYSLWSKADVIRNGVGFPLQHTLSCMNPVNGMHCGVCGKCAERGRAFIAAAVADPTVYASDAWKGTIQASATVRPWE